MARQQENRKRLISRSVLRGVVWILPLLALVSIIAYHAKKAEPPKGRVEVKEQKIRQNYEKTANEGDINSVESFAFDPNTVTYMELRRLGLSKSCAASIIKYRERGKVFSIKEDFATCYGLSDADYIRLEPLIVIGEKFRVARTLDKELYGNPVTQRTKSVDSLFVFDPNRVGKDEFLRLGFTARQWEIFEKYRTMVVRFESAEQFGKCYAVGEEKLAKLLPYIVINKPEKSELVELNSADSATLCSVKGVGATTAMRIIRYRELLGGYHSADQLCEVAGVSEPNFEKITSQIWVDSCEIRKIDVNFAPAKRIVEILSQHPYAGNAVVRKLLKNRQLKGGWRTIGDLEKDDILSTQQAKKLAPYLLFRATTN